MCALSHLYLLGRSENGELTVKDQIQSEYWHIKYYSLLIALTGFLILADWLNRSSVLTAKAGVTVQPEWCVPAEGNPPAVYIKGSFYAVVERSVVEPSMVGESVEYVVRLNDGSSQTIPRRRLRHRVWHRIAFLGVTNEKQHVALTTHLHLRLHSASCARFSASASSRAPPFSRCDLTLPSSRLSESIVCFASPRGSVCAWTSGSSRRRTASCKRGSTTRYDREGTEGPEIRNVSVSRKGACPSG